MALWNKLQNELDRFGRVAQSAFDEGKARLEIMRVRQLADKAAQALGYAVYNARKGGGELDAESHARLTSTLAAHEAEAERLEAQLEAAKAARAESATDTGGTPPEPGTGGTEGGSAGASGTTGSTGSTGSTGTGGVDPAMGDSGASSSGTGAYGSASGSAGGSASTSGSHGTVNPPYSGPSGSSGPY
jgi:hypothetical protein